MKRYYFLLLFVLGSLCLNAQTHDLDPKPMLTESAAIGTATKTTETAIWKGKTYPVYMGSRGGKFIVYLNSKGNWSKKYIPKQ